MRTRLLSISFCLSLLLLAGCGSQARSTPTTSTKSATSTPNAPRPVNVYVETAAGTPMPNSVTALDGATGRPLWRYNAGSAENFVANAPVLAQGVLYINAANSLVALSAQDGHALWTYQAVGAPRVLGVVNGVVYAETFNPFTTPIAAVFALNASDGSVRWSYHTSAFLGGGVLANGVIYEPLDMHDCQCSNPHTALLALNASDGSVKWQTAPASDHFALVQVGSGLLYGLEATEEGPEANVQARSLGDGSVTWQFPKAPASDIIIGLTGSILYVLSNDGDFSNFPSSMPNVIYALNAETGATLWHAAIASTVAQISSLLNGVLYLGASDGSTLIALNGTDGKQLWQAKLGTPGSGPGRLIAASAVVNGVVYVSAPDSFLALNASDGAVLWQARATGLTSIVAVQQGIVYGDTTRTDANPSGQNALYALSASDGTQLWRYDLPALFLTPVVG